MYNNELLSEILQLKKNRKNLKQVNQVIKKLNRIKFIDETTPPKVEV